MVRDDGDLGGARAGSRGRRRAMASRSEAGFELSWNQTYRNRQREGEGWRGWATRERTYSARQFGRLFTLPKGLNPRSGPVVTTVLICRNCRLARPEARTETPERPVTIQKTARKTYARLQKTIQSSTSSNFLYHICGCLFPLPRWNTSQLVSPGLYLRVGETSLLISTILTCLMCLATAAATTASFSIGLKVQVE